MELKEETTLTLTPIPKTTTAPQTVINVNGAIVEFCTTDKFKKYVRQAVNDQMFWRDMLQQISINSLVQTELNNKLPTQVQNEAQKIVTNMVMTKLNDYTNNQLPSHVAKELNAQVTSYLNNNVAMQNILAYHSTNLTNELMRIATETLNKLVAEPQYQMTTNAHLNVMQEKCNRQLAAIETSCNNQLAANSLAFNKQLVELKEKNEREMASLKASLDKVDKLNKKISYLESYNSSTRWMIGGLTALCVGIGSGLYYLNK